jgi:hypothetical protein
MRDEVQENLAVFVFSASASLRGSLLAEPRNRLKGSQFQQGGKIEGA